MCHELPMTAWLAHPSPFILQVDNWNPLTDTVPIHSWIHPWLPLMQARLEPLYSPVRSKLSSALQKWHPSDASAKLILQPWKEVLTPGSWEAFMLRNIVPKLGKDTGICGSSVVYSVSSTKVSDYLGQRWKGSGTRAFCCLFTVTKVCSGDSGLSGPCDFPDSAGWFAKTRKPLDS